MKYEEHIQKDTPLAMMVRFLVRRPIAVFMCFLAFFILGTVSYLRIPISLLPDIAIPEISVQISASQSSARELENGIIAPIRRQLQQISQLRDIKSETRDESAIIRLFFDYGINTDLAFIEVNEKIDGIMSSLPRDLERPRVVKASATDIPVFHLSINLRNNTDTDSYIELGEFADMVIKRRIEQLPEVAMVDITGLPVRQIQITPDKEYTEMLGISIQDIENLLITNNIEFGTMQVRDGYYEYNIKFSSVLRSTEDIGNIYLRIKDQILQLKDIAKVETVIQKEKGLSFTNFERAVDLAIIKQANANMRDLKKVLDELTDTFEKQYPNLEFTVTQNQTELLDYTISNLVQNLWLGFILVCLVSIFFMRSLRIPLIIGCSIFVSLIISLLFFNLFHISLNIISLSGLILAVGMMIDNSIIVTDNISQYREMGCNAEDACVNGTVEIIVPMLSSMLTTIAVFMPLIFMSGIAGAIFFDQAFAIAIGLGVSYFVGILLLPVLYNRLYLASKNKKNEENTSLKKDYLMLWYDKTIDFVFSHKIVFTSILILAFPACIYLFNSIKKERLPQITQNELIVNIDWNENIHIDENKQRVFTVLNKIKTELDESTVLIGQQQYLLKRERSLSSSETEIYLKFKSHEILLSAEEKISESIRQVSSKANFSFSPPGTIFEQIFNTGEPDLIIELRPEPDKPLTAKLISDVQYQIETAIDVSTEGVAFEKQLNIYIDKEKLFLYKVNYNEVYKVLRTAFKDNKVTNLHTTLDYLPVYLESNIENIEQVISETFVYTNEKEKIPLRNFVFILNSEDNKVIVSGRNGEFIPLSIYNLNNPKTQLPAIENTINTVVPNEYTLSGSIFESEKLMQEMVIILLVSLLLMYFILAAQFESFSLPLIVLLEIPIDAAVAIITLQILGHSLNLMSAIGIIVTCGIVINDSILKISMINDLRKNGVDLLEAIHTAGHRRLRAILMTSFTTIFAMVPLLFSSDMGSELQKPLAIATIAAMVIGTLVSIFMIPLIYYLIYKPKTKIIHETI